MIDFKAPYSRVSSLEFLTKFLPDDFQEFDEEIRLDFKPQFIRNIRKIGEVASLDNVHVYEITHESENDPRVSLSKDSFRLLANYGVRRALIFFISENSPNYRFSLVTVDFKWESGARVRRQYSNPRRYSFFLGPDARTHTPYDFLIKKGQARDTTDLLSRFDVEIVTKEFFTDYKGLFEHVRGYFEKDHGFKIFAGRNEIDIDNFAKKLLGQIVFCYFLQRKGWLGAKREESINKGNKDFMRSLFNRCLAEKNNFYNDYLEYLFYGSLNNKAEGSSDFYRKHFDCQIPFLNGGLFEPPEDYDWEESFVNIPDKLFSNNDETGILDVFDLYNFTIYEDDPIDREVSVDPEMLGKVFENLLPENIRKGQGAYYTPREIVHYMCQESLINYLATETKVDTAKIRDLVVTKHFEGEESKESIDKALQNIKICDPACGSGAFLVGMLHEIVSVRHILNPKKDEYQQKKEAIQNCIYGVDIDPGAVDIAKLRLWLSLVVDYELKDIEPLPNLDYKIMCGNSLLEEFEGVRFYDGGNGNGEKSLFKDGRKEKIQELKNKIQEYFNIHDEKEKLKKREEVNKLKDWFIKATLEKRRKEITCERRKIEAKADMFKEKNRQEYFTTQGEIFISEAKINEVLRELHNPQKARPFFIWKLEFMDVFEEKGGFDIVIGNPPYGVKVDENIKEAHQLGSKDSYGVFISTALRRFLKLGGILTYIVSDTWLTIKTHLELRKQVLEKRLHQIIRLHQDCFEATVNSCIFSLTNLISEGNYLIVADLTNISTRKNITELREKLCALDKFVGQSTPIFAVYKYKQGIIKTNSNLPIFVGSPKLFTLMNDITYKAIEKEVGHKEKRKVKVRQIQFNGKVIELVRFGDIADIRVGLQTGDNDYYLFQNPQARGNYKNINEFKEFLLTEKDLAKILSNEELRLKVIEKGFHKSKSEKNFGEDLWFGGRYIVPHDKGGESDTATGWLPNYYVPTEYYINWSSEAVKRLQSSPSARFQNSGYYFKHGITLSHTGMYSPMFRINNPTPFNVGGSCIFPITNINYILGVICAKLTKYFFKNGINHSVNASEDPIKEIFVPINSNTKLISLVEQIIQKQTQNSRYDYMSSEQKEIDKLVYEMYGLNEDDIREVETWYARRYPKLARFAEI